MKKPVIETIQFSNKPVRAGLRKQLILRKGGRVRLLAEKPADIQGWVKVRDCRNTIKGEAWTHYECALELAPGVTAVEVTPVAWDNATLPVAMLRSRLALRAHLRIDEGVSDSAFDALVRELLKRGDYHTWVWLDRVFAGEEASPEGIDFTPLGRIEFWEWYLRTREFKPRKASTVIAVAGTRVEIEQPYSFFDGEWGVCPLILCEEAKKRLQGHYTPPSGIEAYNNLDTGDYWLGGISPAEHAKQVLSRVFFWILQAQDQTSPPAPPVTGQQTLF